MSRQKRVQERKRLEALMKTAIVQERQLEEATEFVPDTAPVLSSSDGNDGGRQR